MLSLVTPKKVDQNQKVLRTDRVRAAAIATMITADGFPYLASLLIRPLDRRSEGGMDSLMNAELTPAVLLDAF